MAKNKSNKRSASDDSNVVRIKASSAPAKRDKKAKAEAVEAVVTRVEAKETKKAVKAEKVKKVREPRQAKGWTRPFRAFGSYFKGAWVELRQVRWPTRRATWSLTFAVLVYSFFFVVLILLLDAGFKYLFDLILGK